MDLLTSSLATPGASEQDCTDDGISKVCTVGTALDTSAQRLASPSPSPEPSSFHCSPDSSVPPSPLHGGASANAGSSDALPDFQEQKPLLPPPRRGLTDPTYGIICAPDSLRPRIPNSVAPLPARPADDPRAALLLQAGEEARKEAEEFLCHSGLPERDKEEAAIDRLLKGLREESQETNHAKIIEWFSLLFALAAAVATIVLGSVKLQLNDPYYRFLVAAVGGEALLAYALPAAIVLWNLYANDDEETNSLRAVSCDRRALFLMNACRILLGVFLLIVAAFGFHSHQQEEGGQVDLSTVKKTFVLVSVCQLGSAFVFAILAVYAWLAARLIANKAMQASAVTAFVEVIVSVVNGWAHFYDSMALAAVESSVGAANKRVKYMEYVDISAAGILFILAVVDFVDAPRSPKVPGR
ncbi:hypothetical protein TGARI_278920 [Toxoplasma gondii ARI]|uniref:Transmembrane protein n=1 Tax=Toxoplasma gondii ARI TaxID=1074872 RepID=A0A139XNR4_TOXGO|nr:hypothetical protein TGARI_278920 [Toxoplasma gondii ARI]